MELDAAVIRTGEAASAEGAGLETEVAAIFLNHDICRDFGGSEEAVFALVDGEVLGDSIDEGGIGVIPAAGEFLKGDGIGAIAIHLVRTHVDEHGVGDMEAGGFKQVESANGIGIEVVEGTGGSEIVAGLRSGVDDFIWLE